MLAVRQLRLRVMETLAVTIRPRTGPVTWRQVRGQGADGEGRWKEGEGGALVAAWNKAGSRCTEDGGAHYR